MRGPYRDADDPGRSAAKGDEIATWESSRACPDCSRSGPVRLFVACRQGVALEACGTCGGVWIDRANALLLFFGDGTGTGVAAELAAHADRAPTRQPPDRGARRCADCGGQLLLRSLHDVEVDACAQHGVWFDRGEVRAALAQMDAATFEEHGPRPAAADADAIVRRGWLNALLQDLANEVVRGS